MKRSDQFATQRIAFLLPGTFLPQAKAEQLLDPLDRERTRRSTDWFQVPRARNPFSTTEQGMAPLGSRQDAEAWKIPGPELMRQSEEDRVELVRLRQQIAARLLTLTTEGLGESEESWDLQYRGFVVDGRIYDFLGTTRDLKTLQRLLKGKGELTKEQGASPAAQEGGLEMWTGTIQKPVTPETRQVRESRPTYSKGLSLEEEKDETKDAAPG